MTALRLLETMASLSLQISLIVAVTAFLSRRVCRRETDRDSLWTGCLAATLLVVGADLSLPHLRILPVPAASLDLESAAIIERIAALGRWVMALWISGALFVLGRLVLGFARGVRLLSHTAVISRKQLPEPWGDLPCTNMDAKLRSNARPIRFLSTKELVSPYCWQLQRATIVLPEVVLSFPRDEIAAVIRHELAHLDYQHPLWLFVQRMMEVLLWFHPAARWAAGQASQTREFVCDATAATTPDSAASLLRALLRLTQHACREPRSTLASPAVNDNASSLSRRAHKLGNSKKSAATEEGRSLWAHAPVIVALAAMLLIWIPIDVAASKRSAWAPWPAWSAAAVQAIGIPVRDYEIDAHRLRSYEHSR